MQHRAASFFLSSSKHINYESWNESQLKSLFLAATYSRVIIIKKKKKKLEESLGGWSAQTARHTNWDDNDTKSSQQKIRNKSSTFIYNECWSYGQIFLHPTLFFPHIFWFSTKRATQFVFSLIILEQFFNQTCHPILPRLHIHSICLLPSSLLLDPFGRKYSTSNRASNSKPDGSDGKTTKNTITTEL